MIDGVRITKTLPNVRYISGEENNHKYCQVDGMTEFLAEVSLFHRKYIGHCRFH